MNKDQFQLLKSALNQEFIDIGLMSDIIDDIKNSGDEIPPMLQGFADCYLNQNGEGMILEAHRVRSVANFIPMAYVLDSQIMVKYLEGGVNGIR